MTTGHPSSPEQKPGHTPPATAGFFRGFLPAALKAHLRSRTCYVNLASLAVLGAAQPGRPLILLIMVYGGTFAGLLVVSYLGHQIKVSRSRREANFYPTSETEAEFRRMARLARYRFAFAAAGALLVDAGLPGGYFDGPLNLPVLLAGMVAVSSAFCQITLALLASVPLTQLLGNETACTSTPNLAASGSREANPEPREEGAFS